MLPKKVRSAPELHSNINYDDVYGSWKLDNVSLQSQCTHLSSKLITPEHVTYMRKQKDRKSILLFLEEKILFNIPCKEEQKEILVKLLWQIFSFFKKNLFTDLQIATVMKMILSTHSFLLSNYWNVAEEIYKYFFERVLRCTVMDPPKCAEIFTPDEVELILEFFRKMYLENIVLLHLVFMNHRYIVMRFNQTE